MAWMTPSVAAAAAGGAPSHRADALGSTSLIAHNLQNVPECLVPASERHPAERKAALQQAQRSAAGLCATL